MNARAQSQASLSSAPSYTPAPVNLVQRKCACGSNASALTGECEDCADKKMLGLQTKLAISEPGDRYEQEADRIADEVMRAPIPALRRKVANQDEEDKKALQPKRLSARITPLVQREAKEEEQDEEEETLQAKGSVTQAPAVIPAIEANIQAARQSSGQPLDPATRASMESRFGHDFSHVRVHDDSSATDATRSVNARAFTVGRDLFFGSGQYAPHFHEGRRLLAHELTHVVQQTGVTQRFLVQAKKKPEPKSSKQGLLAIPWVSSKDGIEGVRDSIKRYILERFPELSEEMANEIADKSGSEGFRPSGGKLKPIPPADFASRAKEKGRIAISNESLNFIASELVKAGVAQDHAQALAKLRESGEGTGEKAKGHALPKVAQEEGAEGDAQVDRNRVAVWSMPGGKGEGPFTHADDIVIDTLTQSDYEKAAESALRVALREAFPEIEGATLGSLYDPIQSKLKLYGPQIEDSRALGVDEIQVWADIGLIRLLLIEQYRISPAKLEKPEGLLFTINIPVATAREAEVLSTVVEIAGAASGGAIAKGLGRGATKLNTLVGRSRKARAARRAQKLEAAVEKYREILKAGGRWEDLTRAERRLVGTYHHNTLQDVITNVARSEGMLVLNNKKLTRELLEELRQRKARVIIIEGGLSYRRRVDYVKLDFSKNRFEIGDLVAKPNAGHQRKTMRYLEEIKKLTGLSGDAIEYYYIGPNGELLEELTEKVI